LPEASGVRELELAPVIAVDEHGVFLDGRQVAAPPWPGREGAPPVKIVELHDQLVTLKNNFKLLHPSRPFEGTAIVLADRETPFATLKRVMYTAGIADYPHIDLVVERKGVANR
jgi:hypothetical protein